MLENLRFHAEEEENYEFFAKKLASYADIYVNECFSVSHRMHASLVRITQFLPSCAGLNLARELVMLHVKLQNPKRPFIAIMGGAKVSDKINVINNLLSKVDKLLLGGAMIFTFYKAQGLEVGHSLCEDESIRIAQLILNNEKVVLPTDIVVAKDRKEGADKRTVARECIPRGWIGLDIGPNTLGLFDKELKNAKTVVWNGPMGLFEIEDYAAGTKGLAKILAGLHADVIVGGGDSASAVAHFNMTDKFTHVSTGGGASLRLLEGKELAAVKALESSAGH
jgi:3-phosphoglycerate kinase